MTSAAASSRGRTGRLDLLQLFFNAAGRLDRRLFTTALVPVCLLARWAAGVEGLLSWGLWFLTLVTGCTLMSKRLHDLSLAGWWAAGPAGLVAVAVTGDAPTTAAQAVALLIAAGSVALLALQPGVRRFNRFGAAPSGRPMRAEAP